MIYLIATAWILLGALLYVVMIVDQWQSMNSKNRIVMLSLSSFMFVILLAPILLPMLIYILISTEIEFAKWKRNNNFK